VIAHGVPELEYPRGDLPPQVHVAGQLAPPPSGRPAPDWWPELLADPRPVVHVTQGTYDVDPQDLLLPALSGLADLDVQVAAATDGASLPADRLPAGARQAAFLPYDRLLPGRRSWSPTGVGRRARVARGRGAARAGRRHARQAGDLPAGPGRCPLAVIMGLVHGPPACPSVSCARIR
jgi:hypothetical protein